MTRTESDRLTILETSSAMHHEAVMLKLEEITADLKALRKDVDDQTDKLAAYENKGKGMLMGAGIAGAGIGAGILSAIEHVAGFMK